MPVGKPEDIILTTWRKEISKEMKTNADSWDGVEYIYTGLTPEEKYHGQRINALWLDHEWVLATAAGDERAFFIWTKSFIYFGISYDGLQRAGSLPRNPKNMKKEPELIF